MELRPEKLKSTCFLCCMMMILPCLLYPKYTTVAYKRSGPEKTYLKNIGSNFQAPLTNSCEVSL